MAITLTDRTKYRYIYGNTLVGQVEKINKDAWIDVNGNPIKSIGSWNYSDYIYIKDVLQLQGNGLSGDAASICFYDKDKKFILGRKYGSDVGVPNGKVTVPTDAVFCRYTIRANSNMTFNIISYR